MPVPSDGLPTNPSSLVKKLQEEFLARPQNVALVSLRRRGCGCSVGAVYRLHSGDLLVGRRRAMVQRTRAAAQARKQAVHLALSEIDEIVLVAEISCPHAAHLALPIPEVRAAVESAARGERPTGEPFLL